MFKCGTLSKSKIRTKDFSFQQYFNFSKITNISFGALIINYNCFMFDFYKYKNLKIELSYFIEI